jgi:hypothetical protein
MFIALFMFCRILIAYFSTCWRRLSDANATRFRQKLRSFSTLILFHALRCRSIFRFISSMILIDIDIWSDDWLNFDLIMQCINLSCSFSNMKIKSMMLHELRVFHVIVLDESVRRSWVWWTTSRSWSIASCCVDLVESLHKKWCKLKSFRMMCFFSSFNCLWIVSMTSNVDIDAYELEKTL